MSRTSNAGQPLLTSISGAEFRPTGPHLTFAPVTVTTAAILADLKEPGAVPGSSSYLPCLCFNRFT